MEKTVDQLCRAIRELLLSFDPPPDMDEVAELYRQAQSRAQSKHDYFRLASIASWGVNIDPATAADQLNRALTRAIDQVSSYPDLLDMFSQSGVWRHHGSLLSNQPLRSLLDNQLEKLEFHQFEEQLNIAQLYAFIVGDKIRCRDILIRSAPYVDAEGMLMSDRAAIAFAAYHLLDDKPLAELFYDTSVSHATNGNYFQLLRSAQRIHYILEDKALALRIVRSTYQALTGRELYSSYEAILPVYLQPYVNGEISLELEFERCLERAKIYTVTLPEMDVGAVFFVTLRDLEVTDSPLERVMRSGVEDLAHDDFWNNLDIDDKQKEIGYFADRLCYAETLAAVDGLNDQQAATEVYRLLEQEADNSRKARLLAASVLCALRDAEWGSQWINRALTLADDDPHDYFETLRFFSVMFLERERAALLLDQLLARCGDALLVERASVFRQQYL